MMKLSSWVLAAALAGCAAAPEPTLYDRLGGRPAIVAAVDEGFSIVATDARIRHHFNPAGAAGFKQQLVDLICLRAGGPCRYGGKDMATAHEGMNIRDAEFDALIDDLRQAMQRLNVPPREQQEIGAIFLQMRGAVVGH